MTMNPHMPIDAFQRLAERLSTIDAEVRSIRAALFQMAAAQQLLETLGGEHNARTTEDFVHQPD
jgi:hypothetical protein